MKKLLLLGLFLLSACNREKTKQQKAELAVMNYLHIPEESDSAKRMKFTDLQLHVIGLMPKDMSQKEIKQGKRLRKTLWFTLDDSDAKVNGVYTN